MTPIKIQFTRFSAFYSPLILTIAGGYPKAEGLAPEHSISPPGKSAILALNEGTAHVVQSAPSQGINAVARGETLATAHFAQINEMDGFFLTARAPDPDFTWAKLAGKKVIVDHGGQPLVMFKYACHAAGLDFGKIDAIDAGGGAAMDKAFRDGEGDYIHQQGPAPQQLEHDGVGHVVAPVGVPIGACAFSSLAARREWLDGDMAKAFMRAYRKARAALLETPAADVARIEQPFFPDIDPRVLTTTIAAYQKLGNWSPHVEITRSAYEKTLDIYQYAGGLKTRPAYESVIAQPPGQ